MLQRNFGSKILFAAGVACVGLVAFATIDLFVRPTDTVESSRFSEPMRTAWFSQEVMRGVAVTQLLCYEKFLIKMGVSSPVDPTEEQLEQARKECSETFKQIQKEIFDFSLKEI